MEKKIGLIPRVVIQGISGPKEYGVLLTDFRAIFVLEMASKANIGGMIGGTVGRLAAAALCQRTTIDYTNEDPERLAGSEHSIVITHSQIRKIMIKKTFGSPYTLYLEYTEPETGKNKKIHAFLIPPVDLVKQKKQEGLKEKVVLEEYVKKTQEAFQHSLPSSTLLTAEWAA
jgi:hypothetical protein